MTYYTPSKMYRLEFGSYLAYSPRPFNEMSIRAYELIKDTKNFTMLSDGTSIIDRIIGRLVQDLPNLEFREFFANDVFLVPVPRSQLMRPGTLWVPREICHALEKNGLGESHELLRRIKPVRQSSRSRPSERPLPIEHYHSLRSVKRRSTSPDGLC